MMSSSDGVGQIEGGREIASLIRKWTVSTYVCSVGDQLGTGGRRDCRRH